MSCPQEAGARPRICLVYIPSENSQAMKFYVDVGALWLFKEPIDCSNRYAGGCRLSWRKGEGEGGAQAGWR
eukprot:scaffold322089_cov44-Tisochrysis_lutea.AAC.2